jgi:hypothetical protein
MILKYRRYANPPFLLRGCNFTYTDNTKNTSPTFCASQRRNHGLNVTGFKSMKHSQIKTPCEKYAITYRVSLEDTTSITLQFSNIQDDIFHEKDNIVEKGRCTTLLDTSSCEKFVEGFNHMFMSTCTLKRRSGIIWTLSFVLKYITFEECKALMEHMGVLDVEITPSEIILYYVSPSDAKNNMRNFKFKHSIKPCGKFNRVDHMRRNSKSK